MQERLRLAELDIVALKTKMNFIAAIASATLVTTFTVLIAVFVK